MSANSPKSLRLLRLLSPADSPAHSSRDIVLQQIVDMIRDLETSKLNGTTPGTLAKYTVSNGTPTRTFNATSTSLNEMANVVAALIVDLQAMKIIQ